MRFVYAPVLTVIFFFMDCGLIKKTASSNLTGTFVYKDSSDLEFGNICFIKFDSGRFSYSCHISHTGTTVEGLCRKINASTVVLTIDKYDFFPTYPWKFYKDHDTVKLLSVNKILLNNKIFVLGTDSKKFIFHGRVLK